MKTRQDLIDRVMKIWQRLQPVYIRQLYGSIPRRIRSVITGKGYIMKY